MRQVIAQILLELNGGALSIDGIPYPVESRILPDGNSVFFSKFDPKVKFEVKF